MKLTTKLPDGKLKVNKAAVITYLKKMHRHRKNDEIYGLLPVSQREIDAESREMTRYNADNLRNTSEE